MPELDFKGKEFVRNHHLTVPFRPLEPQPEKSVGEPDLDGNLIIHGDNLEALKALLPKYAGKVDCIFIDPPYNTGNEGWCYNDNVNSPLLRAWFSENPVGVDDGLRHDKWCCMMWPRLKLLHELLAETGVLLISIDENEYARLVSMVNEVFGSTAPCETLIWKSRQIVDSRNQSNISSDHEYVLTVSKSHLSLYGEDIDRSKYTNPDNDPRGPWMSNSILGLADKAGRPNLHYSIQDPATGQQFDCPPESGWRYARDTMREKIEQGRIVFPKDRDGRPREKKFLAELNRSVTGLSSVLPEKVGFTLNGSRELRDILNSKAFSFPKPRTLVEYLVSQACPDSNALILDSFAGSGTTAHAVLKMNAQDGGNRKFILVECEDYADTVTAERVRRVISGYPFQGTQRETLYEKKLTWTEVKKGDKLVQDAEDQRKFAEQSGDWDKVGIKVEDGVLKVIGERKVEETAPGLGGTFTYCTLGEPLRLRALLEGDRLPSREALGDWLLYVSGAAAQPEPAPEMGEDLERSFLGKRGGICYWLIYEPDLDMLRKAALTLDLARAISATDRNVEHRVFGPQKFVGNKLLRAENLRIEFAQIPYALFRAGAE